MIRTRLKILAGDALGSLNSAIVTLPQALAFGVATGFGASAGIWGTIILCIIAGVFSSVCTKFGLIASFSSAVIAPVAPISFAVTGFPS